METSLQTLSRLVRLTHLPDGSPVQSMQLKCGRYARARLIALPEMAERVSADCMSIGRCFLRHEPHFAPDQWHLAIYPVSGKADLYEGFVE